MRAKRLSSLVLGMLMAASINAATPFTLPDENRVLQSSVELEQKKSPGVQATAQWGFRLSPAAGKGRNVWYSLVPGVTCGVTDFLDFCYWL